MEKPINEIKRMQQLAGIINETLLKEIDIIDNIDDDLMNGGFEDEQGQIEYLQGIIEYCQTLIKQIQSESQLNENEVKTILSKIGDIEEKIYDQYSDDEIEAKFDYSKAMDDIKSKYKNDENKMYDALVSHLKKLKSTFPIK